MFKTLAIVASLLLGAGIASAQSPSGLLTGPVTYTSNLMSGNPYGDSKVWTVANSATQPTTPPNASNSFTCSAAGTPNCYIVKYANSSYANLQASDGTSNGFPNCYTWYYGQFNLDASYPLGNGCENTYHGGGSGEYQTDITCPAATVSNMNGVYSFSGIGCNFGGTAIQVINGADVPITNTFTMNMTSAYHMVWVWIPGFFRTAAHWEHWTQIDSMSVTVTPQS